MKIVIAGGGQAAVESAVAARKFSPDAQIDIYSAESFLPYRRPTLSGLLGADRKLDDKTFYIKNADFFTSQNIGFHPGEKALAVEDSRNGILSAHHAGLKVAMIPDMVPPTPELEEIAWKQFASLFELKNHLS